MKNNRSPKRPGGSDRTFKSTKKTGTNKYKSDKPKSDFGDKKKRNFSSGKSNQPDWKKKDSNDKPRSKFSDKKEGSYSNYKKTKSGWSKKEDSDKKDFKKKTDFKDPKKGTYSKFKSKRPYNKKKKDTEEIKESDGLTRLNKFIANAGICSRREADTYIQTGVVTVNGEIITELGYKVKPDDVVTFGGKTIRGEKPVYILLNKPKDHITSSKDPQNRRTIFDLVKGVKERVFPVGRLDRNTTGVLLLTNDGEMADKLMHPRKKVAKIYHVELDRNFTNPDMQQLKKGLELEDGFFKPDIADYVDGFDRHHVGVEIHSGKNRIVRRLFESMDYKVIKLDRVVYAGLTKKGLTRGKWRFLKDSEVNALKML